MLPPVISRETLDHLHRPRQLELIDVLVGHRAGAHLVEIFRGVDERELIPGGGFGLDDVGGRDHAALEQRGVNQ